MFNCKKVPAQFSRFVGQDVIELVQVDKYMKSYSESLTANADVPVRLFGMELYYLDYETMQCLLIAARDGIGKLAYHEVRRDMGESECASRRAEITHLFRLILGQFKQFRNIECLEGISKINECLPDLVKVAENTGAFKATDMIFESYEYFHAVLDWRWFGLVLNLELPNSGMRNELFCALYQRLLESLIRLARFKYNKIERNDLPYKAQFYCPCIQKLWIGMMALSTNTSFDIDFWIYLQNALDTVDAEKRYRNITVKQSVKSNDVLFQTWLMNRIISLYQTRILDEETFKESPVITLVEDLAILNRAYKEVAFVGKTEEQMRTILLLIKPIYTEWLTIRHDFLVSLWDYFSKRLNSSFQLTSEPLSNLACINRSPAGFMEQARKQSGAASFKMLNAKDSSFKIYLCLLSFVLRHYSETAQKTKVLILFNRTILKIVPPKLETITEQYIYNYSLLMLTMIESTPYQDDYPRLSKQLLKFKLDQTTSAAGVDSCIRRITTITLANLALILTFSARGYDQASHLHHFLKSIEEARSKFGERLQPTLHVLAEGMCTVFDKAISKGYFRQVEAEFLGEWLGKYLKGCSESERDAILKILSRIFDCFHKKTLVPEENVHILQPLYTIVLPYIKDVFSDFTVHSQLVAELAAHFTICSNGQPYASPFLALYRFFSDNATANVDLRLQYFKVIVNSERINEIDEKVIIRSWLKFALLNNRDQLEDISRAVCRLREFQAICEIPEYDLCNGDEEPIVLFFKFLGKKYRQYEGKDSRAQYELTIKVHSLFQYFDKWITNPSMIVLRRIMNVLALALKECGSVIYIKSNSTCLYHVAFNKYFLPISVLTDRNVPKETILAMGKVWNQVMNAMGQMNYRTDPVISDHVTNMMIKWVPQFVKYKDKNDGVKPFVNFFSSQNEPLITFAFSKYSLFYVELHGTSPKPGSENGMKILLSLLTTLCSLQDNSKIALFIRLMAPAILEHALLVNETFATKAIANSLVNNMLQCIHNNSNLIKMELKSCLSTFTKKNLPIYSGFYFRFMYNLADREPEFIKSMIATIKTELAETERLRGGGEDKYLRRLLMQLEGAVEASFYKNRI
ncbi:protein MMS22-like [Topomyia yanbarensis]|uniref:protein MMS22-like n=1 Tax=Topomyia yanbarensis TaxID=2498891 RepID=UPI00273AB2EA|nr:protein MMS22-like [Topomyia yanbarensis]